MRKFKKVLYCLIAFPFLLPPTLIVEVLKVMFEKLSDWFEDVIYTLKDMLLEVGDKVIDIFGNLVTIKEILHHESTKSTNFLIEENGNCYCPNEFAGLFVKYLTDDEFNNLIG